MAGLEDGLVAWFSFTGNAEDASGNGYHGIVHGATLTPDRQGSPDKAYSFDGSSDYIETPIIPANWDEFSLSVWIKISAWTTPYGGILTAREGAGALTGLYTKGSEFNNLQFAAWGSQNLSAISPDSMNIGQWYHVTGTYKKGVGGRLYVNGTYKAQLGDVGTIAMTSALLIGYDPVVPDQARYFNGVIDDVIIHSRALSDVEVVDLFLHGLSTDKPAVIWLE